MTQSDERGYGTAWTRASGVRDAALPSCSDLLQLLRLVHARLSGFKTKCIGVGVVIASGVDIGDRASGVDRQV